jgi:peptidyl-prolyl cis-trans isomerase C
MRTLFAVLLVASIPGLAACRKAPAPASSTASTATPPAATPPATTPPATTPPAGAQPLAGATALKPMPANIPPVLARVNGEAIERWEFDNAVKRVEARAGGPVPPDKRDEVLRNVLDQLVAFHLLAQESRARKIEVPDADVDAQLGQLRGSYPTDEAFQQGIAAQGLTLDQVRQQARTNLQVQKIVDAEIASKVVVQDAEVSAFYQQNLERFKQGDSVHASHILIGLPQNATVEQRTEAKNKAQAVLKQVRGGGDFAALARAESQDRGSAQNGGDLGFFSKGQMTPAFEEAAFATKPGTVSGVVETPFGFHIIKVQERRGPRTAPLTEVGGQIKNFLEQGQREQKLQQFVEQVKTKSKIEILV